MDLQPSLLLMSGKSWQVSTTRYFRVLLELSYFFPFSIIFLITLLFLTVICRHGKSGFCISK